MANTDQRDEAAEFGRRVGAAIEAAQELNRAIHEARLVSPTGEDIHLLRGAARDATQIASDLHLIATTFAERL